MGGWRFNSIQMRITIWTGVCLLLVTAIIIGFAAVSLRNAALREAETQAVAVAEIQAADIETEINTALKAARTLAQALTAVKTEGISITREQVNAMLKQVLQENPSFLGTYTLWEPNAFDGLDAEYANTEVHDETGRFIPYWVRDDAGNIQVEPLVEYETEGIGDWYLRPKRSLQEQIIDPFLYPVQGVDVLMTSLTVPITVEGQFYGITGVDMPIDFIQGLADGVDIYDGTGGLVLISNNGTLAGVTGQADLVGQLAVNLDEVYGEDLAKIRAGEQLVEYHDNQLEVFMPVTFGETVTPWSVNVIIPYAKITAEATSLMWTMIGTGAVLVLAALALLYVIAGRIAQPIKVITGVAQAVAQGNLQAEAEITSHDEVGMLAAAFNSMTAQLRQMVFGLEQTVTERTRDLQTVAEVNQRISTILEVDRLLQDVVDMTKERFGLYHSHIYTLNEAGDTLILTSGAGHVGREMVSENRTIVLDNPQSVVAQAANTRHSITVEDVTLSPTFLAHPLLPNTRSELATPLVARSQLLGVLDVQSAGVGYFTDEIRGVLELLASQVATAISNARLFEIADRTSRHERALGVIDRKLQDAVDMDEILQVAVRELGKAMRVPYTAVELQPIANREANLPGEVTSTVESEA